MLKAVASGRKIDGQVLTKIGAKNAACSGFLFGVETARQYIASEIACFIPHQANLRIIEAIASRLDVTMDRFMINLDRYGNTSAAAFAIALDEAKRTGRFKRGDKFLMVVFGGGPDLGQFRS
jgi:3-oxoacyl-[acyl-carrier-protein] synthase III